MRRRLAAFALLTGSESMLLGSAALLASFLAMVSLATVFQNAIAFFGSRIPPLAPPFFQPPFFWLVPWLRELIVVTSRHGGSPTNVAGPSLLCTSAVPVSPLAASTGSSCQMAR